MRRLKSAGGGTARTFAALFVENNLTVYFGLECSECFTHQLATELLLVSRCEERIAERVRYSHCRDYTVSTDCERNRDYGTHMNNRQSSTFNFLYHRCTATCAGASGTGKNYCLNTVVKQFLCKILCKRYRIINRCAVTYGCVEVTMEFANLAGLFHFAQNINR